MEILRKRAVAEAKRERRSSEGVIPDVADMADGRRRSHLYAHNMAVPYEAYSRRRLHSPSPSQSSLPPIDALFRPPPPYRSPFQPEGVCRSRSHTFLSLRTRNRDDERVERTKLERRLDKLISLHFLNPPPRYSSSFDFDSLRSMRNILSGKGKDIIRGNVACYPSYLGNSSITLRCRTKDNAMARRFTR